MFVVYEGVPNVPSCFKNCPLEPADGTKLPFPVPTKLLISAADWSAVADASIPFNLLWSSSVNTFESDAASTAALISASVWSAVADASIPFN